MNHVTSAPDCDPDYDSPSSHQVNLKMATITNKKIKDTSALRKEPGPCGHRKDIHFLKDFEFSPVPKEIP